jgi:hypothetical protein
MGTDDRLTDRHRSEYNIPSTSIRYLYLFFITIVIFVIIKEGRAKNHSFKNFHTPQ